MAEGVERSRGQGEDKEIQVFPEGKLDREGLELPQPSGKVFQGCIGNVLAPIKDSDGEAVEVGHGGRQRVEESVGLVIDRGQREGLQIRGGAETTGASGREQKAVQLDCMDLGTSFEKRFELSIGEEQTAGSAERNDRLGEDGI